MSCRLRRSYRRRHLSPGWAWRSRMMAVRPSAWQAAAAASPAAAPPTMTTSAEAMASCAAPSSWRTTSSGLRAQPGVGGWGGRGGEHVRGRGRDSLPVGPAPAPCARTGSPPARRPRSGAGGSRGGAAPPAAAGAGGARGRGGRRRGRRGGRRAGSPRSPSPAGAAWETAPCSAPAESVREGEAGRGRRPVGGPRGGIVYEEKLNRPSLLLSFVLLGVKRPGGRPLTIIAGGRSPSASSPGPAIPRRPACRP